MLELLVSITTIRDNKYILKEIYSNFLGNVHNNELFYIGDNKNFKFHSRGREIKIA